MPYKEDTHAEINGKGVWKINVDKASIPPLGKTMVFNKTCPSGTQNKSENARCEAKC